MGSQLSESSLVSDQTVLGAVNLKIGKNVQISFRWLYAQLPGQLKQIALYFQDKHKQVGNKQLTETVLVVLGIKINGKAMMRSSESLQYSPSTE